LILLKAYREKVGKILSKQRQGVRDTYDPNSFSLHRDPRDIFIPDFYIPFLNSLLDGCNPRNILTFGSGSPEISEFALQRYPDADVHYLPTHREDAERIQDAFCRDCHLIDLTFLESDDLPQAFDLVIGRLMVELYSKDKTPLLPEDIRDLGPNRPIFHIIHSALRLNEDGIGIYAVTSYFFFRNHWKEIVNLFKDLGLTITAAFHIPSGMDPRNPAFRYLILVQKKPSDALFIAELGKDPESYPYIISNYRTHKKGKIASLGAWVSPTEFVSFPLYAETERIHAFAKRMNARIVRLSELGKHIGPDRESKYGNSEFVFIPRNPKGLAELRSDIPMIRYRDFLKFDFNPALITGEYLVNYFNSDHGRRQRSALAIGASRPQLFGHELMQVHVVFPNLSIQQRVNEVTNKITQLSSFLEKLDVSVWDDPGNTNEVEHTLDRLLEFDSLERWNETLPFPLSSVLYRYTISTSPRDRANWLVKFYEAVAAFQVILLLSGLCSRGECMADVFEKEGLRLRGSLDIAGFGTWVALSKALRKSIRRKINSTEEGVRDYYFSLFGNPSQAFMDMLLSDKIDSVFYPAVAIRNDWDAHGGIVPVRKYRENVEILEEKLRTIRSIIRDNFREATLVLPGSSWFSEGVFRYTVKVLAGSRPPFKETECVTTSPMDTRYMYLIHAGQETPLQILPLLQMRETPTSEREACYFYNRLESLGEHAGEIRLITYHYGESPAQYIESDEIKKYLEIFRT